MVLIVLDVDIFFPLGFIHLVKKQTQKRKKFQIATTLSLSCSYYLYIPYLFQCTEKHENK